MTESARRAHASGEAYAVEPDWHRPWFAAGVVGGVAAVLAVAVIGLPREGVSLPVVAQHALAIALPTWGTTEPVNEIVYGSRGFDTFGETFLLLAAVVAVGTLTRGREPRTEYVGEATAGRREQRENDPEARAGRGERAARLAEEAEDTGIEPLPDPDAVPLGSYAPERAEAMSVVVRVAARVAAPIVAVAAVYLAAWGYTPGGGFPAGAALVGVALLFYAALGRHAVRRVLRPIVLEPVEMLGAAAIIVVGLVGVWAKGSMFANWLPLAQQQTIHAGGDTQLYSAAELIEVATGLSIAIFALLGMGHGWTPDENDEGDDGPGGGP